MSEHVLENDIKQHYQMVNVMAKITTFNQPMNCPEFIRALAKIVVHRKESGRSSPSWVQNSFVAYMGES